MKRSRPRRKFFKPLNDKCPFCESKKDPDYKEFEELKRYITDRARMISGQRSGVCAQHQRKLAIAIKRARFLALLPVIEKA